MELHLTLKGSGQLSADVYRQLKQAVLEGRLRPGDALPATRDLSEQLSVSRNTVLGAYRRLISEGFLVARTGAGTFVADDAAARETRRAPRGGALKPRSVFRDLAQASADNLGAATHDFRVGVPDPGLFPWDTWRGLVARQLRGRKRMRGYPRPEGDPGLRAAIARHVGVSRSVLAGPDDVMITSGAQQALDLITRVLVEPGGCIAMEEPGYMSARRVFTALGARVVPVRVDADGLDVDALPPDAKLVYVTPSHQFPLGMPMSLARRLALLSWAERHGAAIIEDDYDSEYRFDGRSLEPLQSLDRSGRVLYVGTFSKVLSPTLRIGFVIAPESLMPSLHVAKQLADSHGQVDTQRALAEFMDEGHLARHIRRTNRVYGLRRQALHDALERQLGDVLELVPSAAGLHVTAYFRERGRDTSAVLGAAFEAGVSLELLQPYYQSRQKQAGLVLGYGLIAAQKIEQGIRRLASALPRG